MFEEENRKGLIYTAKNIFNGKIYVGQTICTLEYRILKHKSDSHNKKAEGYDTKFYRAIRKYGIENFEWNIVYGDIAINLLDGYEKYEIARLDTFINGYNSTDGGQNGARLSEETKIKISNSKKGKSSWNKGIPMSEETKKKLSLAKKGQNKGEKRPQYVIDAMMQGRKKAGISDEYRKKMVVSHGGFPFIVYKDGVFIGEWENQSQCSRDLHISQAAINDRLNTRKTLSYKGYMFYRKEIK